MMFPPDVHGKVSPSRLQRIIDCPGSFKLTQRYEEQQSSYAAEGSMLHAATEIALKAKIRRAHDGMISPKLTQEQTNVVQDCMDYYYNLAKTIPNPSVWFEKEVYLKEYHSCMFECYGTCDVILIGFNELHVIDWKFGKGVPVYAQDNDQLYAYAAGAVENFNNFEQFEKIFIHCIQPRLESYDVVELTPQELQFWLESRAIPGVQRAYETHAPFNPGTKQCRWCPARVGCRARHNFANQTAADVFAAHEKVPDQVSVEELGELLRLADQFETYVSDIRAHIQRTLEQGLPFAGWKMVHGRSIRRWFNDDDAADWLTKQLGYDEVFNYKIISPAQAERKDRAFKKNDEFLDMVEKPEGKAKLAPESDSRPPIQYLTAAEKFKETLK